MLGDSWQACLSDGVYPFVMSGKHVPTDYGIRLKEAMRLAGLLDGDGKPKAGVLEKLGKAIGITGAAVGMVLTGQSKTFKPVNSAKAARYLKVDHFWLATGEGDAQPPGLSEEAVAWARRYDRLDVEGRAKFSAIILVSQTGAAEAVSAKKTVAKAPRQREEEKG